MADLEDIELEQNIAEKQARDREEALASIRAAAQERSN